MINFIDFSNRILDNECPTRDECLSVLQTPNEHLLDLLAAAYRIRRQYFGNTVRLQMLLNAKSDRSVSCASIGEALTTVKVHLEVLQNWEGKLAVETWRTWSDFRRSSSRRDIQERAAEVRSLFSLQRHVDELLNVLEGAV